MKARHLILLMVLVIYAPTLFAGVTTAPMQVIGFVKTDPDSYILKLKTLDTPDYNNPILSQFPRNSEVTIYLGFSKWRYSWLEKSELLTLEAYREAIELLQKSLDSKNIIYIGVMGKLCPVSENENVYKSDTLRIYDARFYDKDGGDPNHLVVVAFCKY